MVTLKASYIVKPAEQTPIGIMCLSDYDQVSAITHAPTIYFYRPAAELLVNAIHSLKDSLSKALVIFYPLAGRLHWIAEGRLELNCNSMGAQLLEAESEAKIDDFGDFRPSPEIRSLIPSVNYESPIHEQPLLLVQLTKFSCGGISIGLAISHIVVDGASALHFISEWTRIARGEQPENPPFLDRTVLLPKEPLSMPTFDHSEFSPPPILIGQTSNSEERQKETTVAMLKLSKEQIEKLKNKANMGRASSKKNTSRQAFTRYEAVAGHMWRCVCKARKHKTEQQTRLRIPVDFRSRMEPPLSQGYFGNAIFRAAATATSREIISNSLSYASGKIREAVEKVSDEYLRSSLVFLRNLSDLSQYRNFHTVGCTRGAFYGNPNMEITSWTRLPVYGADFGWGKEIHMGPGAMGFDGKSFILPGRDEDGSFLIALRLQVAHIDAFMKFFYGDI